MKTCQLLQSVVVLVVVSLTSAEGLSLSLSYPDSSNPTIIRFTCKNGEDRAVTATFQQNGEEITDQESSGGILTFMIIQGKGLGDTFTCTDENGITSNAVSLPDAILIKELEDKTTEGGSVVGFVCEAIASNYQPEIVWMFGRYVYRDCNDDSRFCVQSEEFQLQAAKRTWSMLIVETEQQESFIELVTCYVEQDQSLTSTATLTVEKGESGRNEAGIIGGSSVSALVVLITSTVVTTLVVMWRLYIQKKKTAVPSDLQSDPETSARALFPVLDLESAAEAGNNIYTPAGDTGAGVNLPKPEEAGENGDARSDTEEFETVGDGGEAGDGGGEAGDYGDTRSDTGTGVGDSGEAPGEVETGGSDYPSSAI